MSKRWLAVVALVAACDGKPKSTPAAKPAAPPLLPSPTKTVTVDAGWFLAGCVALPRAASREDANMCVGANPPRRLYLSAFEIDVLEVTQQAYATCVGANACAELSGELKNTSPQLTPQMPALVRFEQAQQYCAWQGKRLPTEAEWEKAARGTDGRMYPWGNEPPTCETAALEWDPVDQRHQLDCNTYFVTAVAIHPEDRSPYGALDMAGNAAEWTSDLLVLSLGEWRDSVAPGTVRFADPVVVNPQGPTPEAYAAGAHRMRNDERFKRVMRGGLGNAAVGMRTRVPMDFDDASQLTAGIRCVRSVPSEPPPVVAPVLEATVRVVESPGGGGGFEIRSSALPSK